jgi:gliding motility-associated-like protein
MKKLLPILILFFLSFSKIHATHVVAADLTYECLGGLNYRVNLTLYRDCGGIPMGVFQLVRYSSSSCTSSGNIFLTQDTSYEVSQVCDSLIPQTTCSGGVLPGIEVYVFSALVTLPSHCPDWVFSFDECCRSTSITNLSPGFRFYTKTTLDNTIDSCNSSPVFNSIPVLYSCLNETVNFNNIASDPEGDSLSFHLVRTWAANGTNIPYSPITQTATNPFPTGSGIVFDSVTGQMTFLSTTMQQAIATMLIKEYDSLGNIKGTHMRDIEFIFINCPPPRFNPYTTGINFDTTNYTYRGCYNEPFCFDVMSISYDTANPMELNYYGSLPNATFTKYVVADTTFGQFCWSPDSNDIGNFFFSIEAVAKTCPLKRKNFFNYHIQIDTVFTGCIDTTLILPTSGVVVIDSAMVYDNFAAGRCPLQRIDISKDSFFCSDIGLNNVTITAYYLNGDVKTCNSVVTIIDTISPLAACVDTTVYLTSSGNVRIDSSFVYDYRIVSCGTSTIIIDKSTFDCRNLGPNSVDLILTEYNGLSDTCTGIVTVIDSFPPTAICRNITVYLDPMGVVTIDSSDIDGGSTDNCAIVKWDLSKEVFGCNDIGVNNVWLIVEDYFGLVDSCQAIVTVLDTVGPVINCNDTTVYLSAAGTVTIDSSFVVNVLGDTCGSVSISLSDTSFNCLDIGLNKITIVATDERGVKDSCISTVTVLDTVSPVAICRNSTIQLPASGQVVIDSSFVDNGSYDNCKISTISLSRDTFDCSLVGTNVVIMTVTDSMGNSSSCSALVTVVDTVPPVAICQNLTAYLDATGSVSISTNQLNNGSTDNCAVDSMWLSRYTFTCSEVGSNSVLLSVRDVSGNISICTSLVTILDTVAPVVSCVDTSIFLDANGLFVIDSSFVIGTITSGCPVGSVTLSKDSFYCNELGANQVTLVVSDVHGNRDSCISTVTVLDTVSPVAICQNATIYLDQFGQVSIDSSMINNGSYDNCKISTISLSRDTFDCSLLGTNVVIMTVTDSMGNSSSCSVLVTVLDTVPPVAICQNLTAYLDATGSVSISTNQLNNGSTDNCAVDSMWLSRYTFTCSEVGSNSVLLSVRDVSGNISTCTSIVTILDTVAPVVSCVDTSIFLDVNGLFVIDSSFVIGTITSGCPVGSVTLSKDSFYCNELGANQVTLVVSDVHGNSDSCISTVTVMDTVSPIAICQNATIYLDQFGQVSIDSSMINNGSSDNCAIATITITPSTFDCSDIGVNTVQMTVTDLSGNNSICFSQVTVLDTISPIPSCQDTVVYLNTLGAFTIDNSYIENGSSDICGIDSIWLSKYQFNCFELGPNTVTLYARDSSFNIDSCTAIVTVMDTTNPLAICQDTTIYLNAAGFYVIDSSYINNNPAYGCDISTIKLSKDTFTCNDIGPNSVQMIVTDRNGNSDTCSAIVTVFDTTRPTAICQNITLFLPPSGGVKIDSSFLDNGSYDNCNIRTISISKDSFDCSSVGNNTITLVVTDVNGNRDSCISTVTVVDTVAPLVYCTDTTVYLDQFGKVTIDSSYVFLGSSDNCGVQSISVSRDTFSCADIGVNTVSVTVIDVNGNSAFCQAVVTVLDTILPVAQAGPDTTVCGVTSMNLNATPVLLGQLGSWTSISSPLPISISNSTDPKTQLSGLSNGIYTLVWTVSNGSGCDVDRDTIQINSITSLSALADPDISLCNQYSTTLSAVPTPYGVTGVWSLGTTTSSVPSVSQLANHSISVSNMTEGTYEFFWKVSNNVCPDVIDTVIIEVYDQPAATTGPTQLLCGQYSTTLTGNIPSGRAKGYWSLVLPRTTGISVPSIANDSLGNSVVSGFSEGSYEFIWTVTNGTCPADSDTLRIDVYDQPIANVGPDVVLCGIDSLTLLASPALGMSSGYWSLDTLIAMTPSPIISDSSAPITSVSGLEIGGTQQFIWTVSNGVCPTDRDTLLVSVLERPVVDAGPDTAYCAQYTITLNALPIAQPSVGFWSLDTSSVPNIPFISNPSSPSTTVSGLIEGEYKFIWRGQNFPCYDISDTVTIQIANQYTAKVGPDISLCGQDSVRIVANASNGTSTSKWYIASSVPNVPRFDSASFNSYVSNMVMGGRYEMVWEITNGVCPVSRDTISIVNNYVPSATFLESQRELCENNDVSFFSASGSGLPYTIATKTWQIAGSSYTGSAVTHRFNTAGQYDVTFIVTATNGCSDTAKKTNWITVHENPISDFEVLTNVDRNNSLTIGITDYSTNAYRYLYKFGDGDVSTYSEPVHTYNDSGLYTIWQIVSTDFGCVDSTMKTVFVKELSAYVPSAFSPNNDGINDEFSPVLIGDDPSVYSLIVVNRWGETIFESRDKSQGWDGSFQGVPCEIGTYIWQLVYKDENSTKTIHKRGHVNLIR